MLRLRGVKKESKELNEPSDGSLQPMKSLGSNFPENGKADRQDRHSHVDSSYHLARKPELRMPAPVTSITYIPGVLGRKSIPIFGVGC